MSADPVVSTGKYAPVQITNLAEYGLTQSDVQTLLSAHNRLDRSVVVGSLLGLGLSALLAFRVTRARRRLATTLRLFGSPTYVGFADGTQAAIPDISSTMKSSALIDMVTISLFGLGGYILGGKVGRIQGTKLFRWTVGKDLDSQARIEIGVKRSMADLWRKQADALDKQTKVVSEVVRD